MTESDAPCGTPIPLLYETQFSAVIERSRPSVRACECEGEGRPCLPAASASEFLMILRGIEPFQISSDFCFCSDVWESSSSILSLRYYSISTHLRKTSLSRLVCVLPTVCVSPTHQHTSYYHENRWTGNDYDVDVEGAVWLS